MSDRYLVLGAGPVGRAVSRELLERGGEVTIASRSGRPGPAGARPLALDATDAAAVTTVADGAAAVFNCLNPPHYHRWPDEWPPMAHAALEAASTTGAVLATASNLYPYVCRTPITAATPENPAGPKGAERARMWREVCAAIAAGRLHAVEVRSADYLGDGAYTSASTAIGGALRGRTAWLLGRPDQPHSFAFVPDVARTLVAAALTPAAWDRLWITPSAPARTQGEMLDAISAAAGHGRARVRPIPEPALGAIGLFVPLVREQRELRHQRLEPFTVDASETTQALGIDPTPWPDVIANIVAPTQAP